jgi:hypothetical protein
MPGFHPYPCCPTLTATLRAPPPILGIQSRIFDPDRARRGHHAGIGLVRQTFIRRARQSLRGQRGQRFAHDG